MNPELELYKKRRIATLRNIYITNCKNTVQYYNKQIYIMYTRRIVNKAEQIKKLKSDCNKAILLLTQKMNADILAIQNITPTIDTSFKNKKALLIGINYIGTPAELSGCINDTESIKTRLTTNYGFNVANIETLTDNTPVKPTRANILSHLTTLLANAVSGDLLFFLYSGHGSYTIDRNGDENDGRDEMIIPLDMIGIIDDELKQIIQTNLKTNVTLVALFDSCFSGSVLDLRYQYLDSLNYDSFTENDKQLDTQGNVIMISGCSDTQTSADTSRNGAMTMSFLECATPNISWRDLLKNMRTTLKASGFPQLPQMSSGSIVNIDHKVFLQTI